MKNNTPKYILRSLALGFAALLAYLPAQAATTVILSDTFTVPSAVILNNRTPEVSLPGTKWKAVWLDPAANSEPYLHSDDRLRTRANGAGYINISSAGSYVKPELLTISVSLSIGSLTAGTDPNGNGIALGFYSGSPAQSTQQASIGFTGLILTTGGKINLVNNGVVNTSFTTTISDFSASTTYALSYSVNTSTGSLTSIFLNGTDLSGTTGFTSITGIFTDSATVHAGYFGRSGTSGTSGVVDNFQLSTTAIPEANALWMMPAVFAFAFVTKRRRRS